MGACQGLSVVQARESCGDQSDFKDDAHQTCLHVRLADTPIHRVGMVRRWVALLDAAEDAIATADPNDPVAQRAASRRLDGCAINAGEGQS